MKQHKVLQRDCVGGWELTLAVSHHGRFIVHMHYPGEPSWTRTVFRSHLANAAFVYHEWRRERVIKLAVEALGVDK